MSALALLYATSAAVSPKLPFCHPPPSPSPSPSPSSYKKVNLTSSHSSSSGFFRIRSAAASSKAAMAAADSTSSMDSKPFAVLFVCLGNICRSPAAEGVFRSLVGKRGLNSRFTVDSAGTIGYHEGNLADPRMWAASKRRGIEITSLSRLFRPSDFSEFDLILAMDKQNKEDILAAYERWSFKETLPANAQRKVKLMCSYCKKNSETEVPDPYYGGPQGFEKVLDLLEDACESLLDSVLAENK